MRPYKRQHKTSRDKSRQDKTKHNKTRQDKIRQDKTRQDKTRYRRDETRHANTQNTAQHKSAHHINEQKKKHFFSEFWKNPEKIEEKEEARQRNATEQDNIHDKYNT